jgi:hypothetical protein
MGRLETDRDGLIDLTHRSSDGTLMDVGGAFLGSKGRAIAFLFELQMRDAKSWRKRLFGADTEGQLCGLASPLNQRPIPVRPIALARHRPDRAGTSVTR